jgi:hypothetical protein
MSDQSDVPPGLRLISEAQQHGQITLVMYDGWPADVWREWQGTRKEAERVGAVRFWRAEMPNVEVEAPLTAQQEHANGTD